MSKDEVIEALFDIGKTVWNIRIQLKNEKDGSRITIEQAGQLEDVVTRLRKLASNIQFGKEQPL